MGMIDEKLSKYEVRQRANTMIAIYSRKQLKRMQWNAKRIYKRAIKLGGCTGGT